MKQIKLPPDYFPGAEFRDDLTEAQRLLITLPTVDALVRLAEMAHGHVEVGNLHAACAAIGRILEAATSYAQDAWRYRSLLNELLGEEE